MNLCLHHVWKLTFRENLQHQPLSYLVCFPAYQTNCFPAWPDTFPLVSDPSALGRIAVAVAVAVAGGSVVVVAVAVAVAVGSVIVVAADADADADADVDADHSTGKATLG